MLLKPAFDIHSFNATETRFSATHQVLSIINLHNIMQERSSLDVPNTCYMDTCDPARIDGICQLSCWHASFIPLPEDGYLWITRWCYLEPRHLTGLAVIFSAHRIHPKLAFEFFDIKSLVWYKKATLLWAWMWGMLNVKISFEWGGCCTVMVRLSAGQQVEWSILHLGHVLCQNSSH